ncbi:hypothetical protein ACJRO7_010225 [Eucalyptus globulus]|uniref:O-fucosyltransferase family protein n=1 Tax=Eucalyptus globulus TaxID=34317 RepID=A0ABD3LBC8_EUCGL
MKQWWTCRTTLNFYIALYQLLERGSKAILWQVPVTIKDSCLREERFLRRPLDNLSMSLIFLVIVLHPPPLIVFPPSSYFSSKSFVKINCDRSSGSLLCWLSARTELDLSSVIKAEAVACAKSCFRFQKLKFWARCYLSAGISWPFILPLFSKHKVVHFNKTDARLANNGISLDLQRLRFHLLRDKGPFMALHLRYEMDMLAFSGCTQGCTAEEAEELKRMRYAFPWWREKEIVSEERRSQGLCPPTPEETSLVLQALGFDKDMQINIASGEIYGSERRLATLRAAYPQIVKKEMLLDPKELQQFHNHSSQMAALDFMVSIASNTFIPTYDGNMAKLVEGHCRYLGFKRTVLLDHKKLVVLLDFHRRVIVDKPKEEDYFYANTLECLCEQRDCDDLLGPGKRNFSEVSS